MRKKEARFWDFVIRHRLKLLMLFCTLLSLYARFAFRGFVSVDMLKFLSPWFEEFRRLGGIKALSTQIGNYQISYQTLIALLSYLPVNEVYAYKALSCLFDYAMGAAVAGVVVRMTGSGTKGAVSYAVITCFPIVVLNSAVWGQCDSIYTFFLVAAFWMLLWEKHTAAFLCYGMALAFKLQAVFLLPFLLFYYVWSRKFSGWRFLLIPVPTLLFSLLAVTQGRSLLDTVMIYVDQSRQYTQISMNYPSFWNLIVVTLAQEGVDCYQELHVLCLAVTFIILGTQMVGLIQKKKLSWETLAVLAAWTAYTCVLFLPAMHERYTYPALIFVLMCCFLSPRVIPVALGMLIIDMSTYGKFLFDMDLPPWSFLVILNLVTYAGLTGEMWKMVQRENIQT